MRCEERALPLPPGLLRVAHRDGDLWLAGVTSVVTGAHQEGADVGLRTGVSSVADVGPVHRQPPANVDNLLGVCCLHVSSKAVRSSALQLPQWGPPAAQCPG